MAAFESDRLFQIWSFSPSHRTMLLRSNPSAMVEGGTRIEIFISHVEAMCIKSNLEGLRIWRPSPTEAEGVARTFGLGNEVESLYLISSGDFRGFVLGGRPSWREAVRDLEDKTLFDFSQEWPPGPEMSWGDIE